MRYVSLFSGIEAASVALEPLGWTPVGFAEIEPHPRKVLEYRYPHVPNLGDVTKLTEIDVMMLGQVDVLIFGSPCQDLSVAGKRKGLAGERSGLFHTAMRIVRWAREHCGLRFAWWENVPGAFSSNKGQDFAVVLGEMAGLDAVSVPPKGWGNEGAIVGEEGMVEWSTLDAQWFGVAQRRRRVFAIADFGDWANRPPILLEPQGVRGDSAPSRGARKGTAGTTAPRAAGNNEQGFLGMTIHGDSVAPTLDASIDRKWGSDQWVRSGQGVLTPPAVANCLTAGGNQRYDFETETLLPVSYSIQAGALRTNPHSGHGNKAPPIAFHHNAQPLQMTFDEHTSAALTCSQFSAVMESQVMQVRRLTPRECERLQGFYDNWTLIPKRFARLMPDGAGPCVKQTVTATVVDKKGKHWIATNHCMTPQTACPRAGMPTGVGYELCRSVCAQPVHAEINAIQFAGKAAKGATLYVEGHTYACDACLSAARDAGITRVVIGSPPMDADDGPRYKALGNSMAVPVINWIGRSMEASLSEFWQC